MTYEEPILTSKAFDLYDEGKRVPFCRISIEATVISMISENHQSK